MSILEVLLWSCKFRWTCFRWSKVTSSHFFLNVCRASSPKAVKGKFKPLGEKQNLPGLFPRGEVGLNKSSLSQDLFCSQWQNWTSWAKLCNSGAWRSAIRTTLNYCLPEQAKWLYTNPMKKIVRQEWALSEEKLVYGNIEADINDKTIPLDLLCASEPRWELAFPLSAGILKPSPIQALSDLIIA